MENNLFTILKQTVYHTQTKDKSHMLNGYGIVNGVEIRIRDIGK